MAFTVLAWVLLLGGVGVKCRDFLRGQSTWGPWLLFFLSSLSFITVACTQLLTSGHFTGWPGMAVATWMVMLEPALKESKKDAPGQPEGLVEAIDRLTAARAAGQITHQAAVAELETSHGQTPTAAEILLGEPAAAGEPAALPRPADPA